MWLIDENLHTGLHKVLAEFGISSKSVSYAGLSGVDNGALTKAAHELGYRCILTRDHTFPRDAGHALAQTPEMAIVIVKLPQNPPRTYLERFKNSFALNPIVPRVGDTVEWG